MVVPLSLLVALLSAATPTPEPSAAASSPLKEIGHVYSNGACTAIVVRANSAISSALRNDQTMTLMVASLRAVNLDSPNRLERLNGRRELEKYSNELRLSAVHAMGEVKQLRKLADESVDPVRKAELKDFADALAGALQRQQRIGADMQGMLVRIAGRESRVDVWEQMVKTSPELAPPWPDYADVHFDKSVYNLMALNEAKYVELQMPSIQDDESHAADHVIGAVSGC